MTRPIEDLLAVMAALRDPETGCPWDVKQSFDTIVPYTIEEAYEVADAIERNDIDDLREELGDLLLQVVFHARMAEEAGHFAFGDVVSAIHDKMVRRHPHVFGDGHAEHADEVKKTWDEIKAAEKAERAARRGSHQHHDDGVLDGIPRALPGNLQALKLQKVAAKVGFDWSDLEGARSKLDEELAEFDGAVEASGDIEDEFGDVLFSLINVARKAGIDPDTALRRTNAKFRKRFAHMESELKARGIALEEAGLRQLDQLWTQAKRAT